MRSDRTRGVVLAGAAPRAAFQPIEPLPSFTQDEVDDAYARGFLAGTEDAQADARRAATQIAGGFDQARAAVIDELRRIDASRREEIVDFAFEVARWLVQTELTIDPAKVIPRLEAALPDRIEELSIRVAPKLVDIVRAAAPEAQVVADASLALGDLRLVAPDAQVDGTIEDALNRLRVFLSADDGTLA
jgi:flagellar biosynthesis/type III secretory pathway protein FliH